MLLKEKRDRSEERSAVCLPFPLGKNKNNSDSSDYYLHNNGTSAQPSPLTPTYTTTTLLLGVIPPHSLLMYPLLTLEKEVE